MDALLDPEFWARWLSIVVIDLTLAGDNALVIALAVRTLPRKQQWQGRLWGTAGAVVLRLGFIAVATVLLRIPFLQLVGGLLLVWIAVKLVRQPTGGEHGRVREGATLREAVWIIVVADAVMSLDNVLAVAAAAHGDLLLVVFGIALSLPLVVWGSGLLARLMTRFGWIVWLGGGILGYVATEMMLADPALKGFLGEALETLGVLPTLLGVTIAGLGWWVAARAPASRASASANGTARIHEN
jgi:YjbE family integral membrane protein